MEIGYELFYEKLAKASKIRCNRRAVLQGEQVYHILGIFDDNWVALKYYDQRDRIWHYFFTEARLLWQYLQDDWIGLRG